MILGVTVGAPRNIRERVLVSSLFRQPRIDLLKSVLLGDVKHLATRIVGIPQQRIQSTLHRRDFAVEVSTWDRDTVNRDIVAKQHLYDVIVLKFVELFAVHT